MVKTCFKNVLLMIAGFIRRSSRAGILWASSFSLHQPLLEPGTFFLRPVPFAIPADGHVLTADGEAFRAVGVRRFFGVRASRFIDACDFRHDYR